MQDRRWPAVIVEDSPYDPANARLRADIDADTPAVEIRVGAPVT
jgi:hypothetical protein